MLPGRSSESCWAIGNTGGAGKASCAARVGSFLRWFNGNLGIVVVLFLLSLNGWPSPARTLVRVGRVRSRLGRGNVYSNN